MKSKHQIVRSGSRQRAQQRTRRDLMAAGERLFAEKGFASTSLEDIARRAGYTRGAFHSNFESKEALFDAIVASRFDRRTNELRAHLESDPAPLSRIEAEAPAGAAERLRWRVLLIEYWLQALRNPQAKRALRDHFQMTRREIGAAAEELFGDLGGLEPSQVGALEVAMELGLAIQRAIDPEAIRDDLLFRGIEFLQAGATEVGSFTTESSVK